jgi:peptidoglycan-associated lipoprotein
MKLSIKFVTTILLGLMIVLSGCQKKPTRPNPNQTMFGPGSGSGLNVQEVSTDDMFADADSGLEMRDGTLDLANANQERGILPNVYFGFNASSIDTSERAKLSEAAQYLQNNPGAGLLLEGHCDWRGTAEYNLGLGDRRANSVLSFLETLGVSSDRLQTLSKGDLEAIESESSDQLQDDRRVELVILR